MLHVFKHYDIVDKIISIVILVLLVVNVATGDWWGVVLDVLILLWIFILAGKQMTIDHQNGLITDLLAIVELASKAVGDGNKIVKKTTTEFSIEKITKEGKNGSKDDNKKKSGRSGGASKKASSKSKSASRKSANGGRSKAKRPESVRSRQQKTTKKNS